MILFGVALSVLAVVVVGLVVARKIDGDSTNFLVAGRNLALPFAAATLMGQAVDTNATLGNTDGWPTFIAFGGSLVTFVVVSLLTGRGAVGTRGVELRVREEGVEIEREVVPAGDRAAVVS